LGLPSSGEACDRLTQAVQAHPRAGGSQKRALNQALRELLLAQASDWAFMMKTGHHGGYARARVQTHLDRLNAILDILENGVLKMPELLKIERLTPCFQGWITGYCQIHKEINFLFPFGFFLDNTPPRKKRTVNFIGGYFLEDGYRHRSGWNQYRFGGC